MIPYGRQSIVDEDISAVVDVLQSDFLTQGPAVPRFEEAVKAACGATHAFAVNSATSALHIACIALDVGPGDIVWTSPITFVASSNCALYCGASVDFVDVNPHTANMCPDALQRKLVKAASDGTLPKVVIPVHFTGEPCDMDRVGALAKEYGFGVVEDGSHAIGSSYMGKPIGCGEHSDITVFSFHPVKIVTTAEGGMALTNDDALAQRLDVLRSHGITRDTKLMTGTPHGPWYYEQQFLGYNYRMTDIQAALGTSQMTRLNTFIDRRHEIARRYDELLADLPVVTLERSKNSRSALHLYPIQISASARNGRRAVFEHFRAHEINVQVHYMPVHRQPYYEALGFKKGQFPAAEAYYDRAISIPMFPALTNAEQDRVVSVLADII